MRIATFLEGRVPKMHARPRFLLFVLFSVYVFALGLSFAMSLSRLDYLHPAPEQLCKEAAFPVILSFLSLGITLIVEESG